MNNTSVAVICVALIGTPAGYAFERLHHVCTVAAPIAAPDATLTYGRGSVYAGNPAWLKQRAGDAMYKPGRV